MGSKRLQWKRVQSRQLLRMLWLKYDKKCTNCGSETYHISSLIKQFGRENVEILNRKQHGVCSGRFVSWFDGREWWYGRIATVEHKALRSRDFKKVRNLTLWCSICQIGQASSFNKNRTDHNTPI